MLTPQYRFHWENEVLGPLLPQLAYQASIDSPHQIYHASSRFDLLPNSGQECFQRWLNPTPRWVYNLTTD